MHRGTPGDQAVYTAEARDATRILELGCGYGRMLDVLIGPGRDVVGIDVHEGLLALARARIEGRPGSDRVSLQVQDMCTLELDGTFDCIMLPYNGIYCLLEPSDLMRALERVACHLSPQGRFVFDGYDADDFHRQSPNAEWGDNDWFELPPVDVDGETYDVFERSRWEKDRQRFDVTYRHLPRQGGPMVEASIPQRYLLTSQLGGVLAAAGLQLERVEHPFVHDDDDDDDSSWLAVAQLAT